MTPLLWCLVAVLVSVVMFPLTQRLHNYMTFDDTPALIIHRQEMLTPKVRPGESVHYHNWYSKRGECHPPLGGGEVTFRLSGAPDSEANSSVIFEFDMRRTTRWPPGENLEFRSVTPVPKDVPPGKYMFEQISTYVCDGASKPQIIRSPALPITIIG